MFFFFLFFAKCLLSLPSRASDRPGLTETEEEEEEELCFSLPPFGPFPPLSTLLCRHREGREEEREEEREGREKHKKAGNKEKTTKYNTRTLMEDAA